MTDRYNALVVVLDRDIREDDAEFLISAIKMLRGVASVQGNVSDISSLLAEERAVNVWREKIRKVLWP